MPPCAGERTFCSSDTAVAALLVSLFPRLPTTSTDNRCHLQVKKKGGRKGGQWGQQKTTHQEGNEGRSTPGAQYILVRTQDRWRGRSLNTLQPHTLQSPQLVTLCVHRPSATCTPWQHRPALRAPCSAKPCSPPFWRAQAFRHLYTLATQPRCLEAIDVDSGQSVHVPLAISTSLAPQQATAQQATDPRAAPGAAPGAAGTQRAAADASGSGTAAAAAAQGTGAHLGAVQAPGAGVAQGAMVTVTPCLLPERRLVSRELTTPA